MARVRIQVAKASDLAEVKNEVDQLESAITGLVLTSGSGYVYPVTPASANWYIPNNMGRPAQVTFYLDGLGPILQSYVPVPGGYSVSWPYPVSGYAVLT